MFWDQLYFFLDHLETVRSTVVKLIVPYQHKFSLSVYYNHRNTKHQIVKISKDEKYPVISVLN